MYDSHSGLRQSPFHNLGDPRYFHCGSTHEEALARLQFLVDHGRRLGLLAGTPGSGKTVLLDVFARQMQGLGNQVARLNLLSLDSREFLWDLVSQLKLHPRSTIPRLNSGEPWSTDSPKTDTSVSRR